MRTLILTVGLPRAGKSTWAKARGYPVVNPDSIRLALHGQAFQKEAEGFVWAIAKVMVQSLFLSGHDVVVLDATNTTAKRRDEWMEVADRVNALVKYKVIYRTPQDCRDQAVRDQKDFLVPVINRMSDEWDHPPTDQCL